jgi:hypothetical protein
MLTVNTSSKSGYVVTAFVNGRIDANGNFRAKL